jgi:hypothetical protein
MLKVGATGIKEEEEENSPFIWLLNYQSNDTEMGRTYSKGGREETTYKVFVGRCKGNSIWKTWA